MISIPMIRDHGIICLKSDTLKNEDITDAPTPETNKVKSLNKIYHYYIMPFYPFSLNDFYHTTGMVYIDRIRFKLLNVYNILEIGIKITEALE